MFKLVMYVFYILNVILKIVYQYLLLACYFRNTCMTSEWNKTSISFHELPKVSSSNHCRFQRLHLLRKRKLPRYSSSSGKMIIYKCRYFLLRHLSFKEHIVCGLTPALSPSISKSNVCLVFIMMCKI